MFQFHQNNSQLLFHIIVSLWGAGAFSRDFTTNLARWCRAFTRALKNEKLKAPPFPGPGGAGDTNRLVQLKFAICAQVTLFSLKNNEINESYKLCQVRGKHTVGGIH